MERILDEIDRRLVVHFLSIIDAHHGTELHSHPRFQVYAGLNRGEISTNGLAMTQRL